MARRVMKIKTPFSYPDDIRLNDEPSLAVQSAVQNFDRILWETERLWGVDRLPALVSDTTRQKWWTGIAMLNDAIRSNDRTLVTYLTENLISGIKIMIAEAKAAGYAHLNLDMWETSLSDGRVLRLVRAFPEDAYRDIDNRDVVIWSLSEVAKMVDHSVIINQVKETFPGSTISDVTAKHPE